MKKPTTRKEMLEAWQQAFEGWLTSVDVNIFFFFKKLEDLRKAHLPIAEAKGWKDWTRALTALERHGLASWQEIFPRLQKFVSWAEAHENEVEPWLLAYGLFRMAYAKSMMQDYRDARNIYHRLIARFSHAEDPALFRISTAAYLNIYNDVLKNKGLTAAGLILDEIRGLAKFHDEPCVRIELAKILVNALNYANDYDKKEEATKILSELRALAEAHGEPTIRIQYAWALFKHGVKSGDTDEAYDVFTQAMELVEGNQEDDAQEIATQASLNRSRLTCQKAKAARKKAEQTKRDKTKSPAEPKPELTSPRAKIRKLKEYLEAVIRQFSDDKEDILDRMELRKQRYRDFLQPRSLIAPQASVLFVLRKWNSFTPIIADGQESDRGGGYFLFHKGVGLVVDPGYDFIEHFHQAGCRIHDITHIAVTHAHDDHTAQLEQLLTLFHQYNGNIAEEKSKKKVVLLLNHSTMKKFSGFRLHRDCGYVKQVICLNAYDGNSPQVIQLGDRAKELRLTVLPAYHDDVFSTDYAVGLGLEVATDKGKRRLVLTGDTGLFPPKYDEKGEVERFTSGRFKGEKKVREDDPGLGVHVNYPEPFGKAPHLLVPHMGSVKPYELDPQITSEEPMFYPNHLGLLGTTTLIKELDPEAVILSEFGSELRDSRMIIAKLLTKAMKGEDGNDPCPFLVPGDAILVYNIPNGRFLCHEDCRLHDPKDIKAADALDEKGSGEVIGLFLQDGTNNTLKKFRHSLNQLIGIEGWSVEGVDLPHMVPRPKPESKPKPE